MAKSTPQLMSIVLGVLALNPQAPAADSNTPIIPPAWKTVADRVLTPAQVDALLTARLPSGPNAVAAATTDEQFLRRVSLDLIGKLPTTAEIEMFARSTDPAKRSAVIDRLLASEDFNRYWAKYWRDVIVNRATATQFFLRLPRSTALEVWFRQQFKEGKSWADITKALITAEGALELQEPEKNGAAGFLLCHTGPDAAVERAAETSRVFLGIQIQCAQCHDHPSDLWKRQQFHEFAAYYGRARDRLRIGMGTSPGAILFSMPFGEYSMPDLQNPSSTTTIHPRFLTGQGLERGQSDRARRQALAELLTARDNYWFSAAFVNRTWAGLVGQGFYNPIDNLGPLQEATHPEVLLSLAASFRASNYNIKDLFRLICSTAAYQRQMRLGESEGTHLQFTGVYPARLPADALWQSLVSALGPLDTGLGFGFFRQAFAAGRPGPPTDLKSVFKALFDYDPSTRPDEVEGSVPQALLLMNNPTLAGKLKATGDTTLAKLLKEHPRDEDALGRLYLSTLGRHPTTRERQRCLEYVKKLNNRPEAYEDLLWALINSTEFQTKR